MTEKTYLRILVAIIAAGVILTVVHLAYAAYAYSDSSIIYFITKEWW